MSHGTSTTPPDWSTAFEDALRLPVPPSGFWYRVGLSPRGERRLEIAFGLLLYALAVGWIWSLSHARTLHATESETAAGAAARTASTIATALTSTSAPSTAYLTDAALNALFDRARGVSGKLRAAIDTSAENIEPDSLPPGAELRYSAGGEVTPADTQPRGVGVWNVALAIGNAIKPITDFNVITELPFRAKSGGKIGLYYIGNWPAEKARSKRLGPAKAPSSSYANPGGFIQVTQDNADTYVSEHFRLRDFLTHDQPNV
ncbi:MAG TPA: hypothetical protein VJW73_23685, partial [Gemmatimonadaceae bacterium]|nr:hypothetical protein [Gemmatimonadaceae bacterium]